MKRFKNIALLYDCDRGTSERAALLAKHNRARLTIVQVLKDLPVGQEQMLAIGGKRIDLQKLVKQECQARLQEASSAIESFGVRSGTRLLIGEPFLEIIGDVIEQHRDLVIMTAEGKGGLSQWLFGTTSSHLMRKCPCPVLVLKPGVKRFRRIMAAIDPEVTGEARDTLNGLILELAASLAAGEGAELHIVHAWQLFGEQILRGRGEMSPEGVDREVRREAKRRRKSVEALLAKHVAATYRLHLPKGPAAETIPRLASKLGINLLVMGTVCRTGIPGFIIGNTAERVLDAVNCSVLTVKPEGFVSPVAPQFSRNRN